MHNETIRPWKQQEAGFQSHRKKGADSQITGEVSMPSIRLMGFAAGALFFLSSTGNSQSLQAPGKAMPTGQAPSKVLPQPQGPGKGMPAAYGNAGSMGYSGGGYSGGTAGYPGGYDFGRPGYNPGGLGGPRSGLGVRPGVGLGGLGVRR